MKKRILSLFLMLSLLLNLGMTGCSKTGNQAVQDATSCTEHADTNFDNLCDFCQVSLLVYVDFYAINDLHGKIADGEGHPGVDELTTFLKNAELRDDYLFLLSSGDMWQGSSESNLTDGHLTTEWMNALNFVSMTMGNHEYDWGEDLIESNDAIAEFPFLAINIYDKETNELVDYCQPSVVVEAGGIKIGIIGAIGDCYSSISGEQVKDVYFKVGKELTELVKAESTRLREEEGVDCIVYSLHDGYGRSKGEDVAYVGSSDLSSYYDTRLSDGYVDVVFEAHTHQQYLLMDQYGVYHLQNRGDNSGGISHVELAINQVTGQTSVNVAELISTTRYENLNDDAIVEELLAKYSDELAYAYEELGYNANYRNSNYISRLVANLYLKAGTEKWGSEYNIVLGGGSINIRKPYNLNAGMITYADIYPLLPFDNELVLCSISGADLQKRFLNNSDYVISLSSYGQSIQYNIDPNKTYYIILDTWSSLYAPNNVTEIARFGSNIYARDLLAQYIASGGLSK